MSQRGAMDHYHREQLMSQGARRSLYPPTLRSREEFDFQAQMPLHSPPHPQSVYPHHTAYSAARSVPVSTSLPYVQGTSRVAQSRVHKPTNSPVSPLATRSLPTARTGTVQSRVSNEAPKARATPAKKPAVVSKTTGSPRTSKTSRVNAPLSDPSLPALTIAAPPPSDANYIAMDSGLRAQQQDWTEKMELKKLISDVVHLCERLNSVIKSQSSNELNQIDDLIQIKLPSDIEQMQLKLFSRLQSLQAMDKDLQCYEKTIKHRSSELEELHEINLVETVDELTRAKRKRRFQSEFERLAIQILSKKKRTAYAEERKRETEKMNRIQKDLELWKDLGELRQRQADAALLHVKDLLDSLRSPETAIKLLEQSRRHTERSDSPSEIEPMNPQTDSESLNMQLT